MKEPSSMKTWNDFYEHDEDSESEKEDSDHSKYFSQDYILDSYRDKGRRSSIDNILMTKQNRNK